MRRIFLEQGTPAWHRWRSEGIGGSDIPALLNRSPYDGSNPESLWEEKALGQSKEANFAMGHGTRLEPIARRSYETYSGLRFEPICCEHPDHHWMHASLDGWHPSGAFIEIKYSRAEWHWMALNGIVPKHVQYQMQWQFLVTGCQRAAYVSVNDGQKEFEQPRQFMAVVEVFPDPELAVEILEHAERFWQRVKEHRWPKQHENYDPRKELQKWAESAQDMEAIRR